MIQLNRVSGLVLLGCLGTGVQAAESPDFNVGVKETHIVEHVTVATGGGLPGFKAHANFPYLKKAADGTLYARYTVGQTQSSASFGKQAVSTDRGKTWTVGSLVSAGESQLIKPSGQTSYGFSVGMSSSGGTNQWSNSRYLSGDGGNAWSLPTTLSSTYYTYGVSYHSMSSASFSDVIELNDGSGTWVMSAFGKRVGASTLESVLFASVDQGQTWHRRSTIADHTTSQNFGAMGSEGPNETAVLRLDNGNLLAVYRTGQPFPNVTSVWETEPSLFWGMSSDNGQTWTTPKTLGVAGVNPIMRKLGDGSVALVTGRYGGRIMFADETGLRWTQPKIIYSGPGSGHVDLQHTLGNEYAFVYDQSSFFPPSWNGTAPSEYVYDNEQSANIVSSILTINRTTATDPYNWSLEYHGDHTPDSVSPSWAAASSGTVSARLLAEHGQDYMRFDTDDVSGSNLLNYTLDGTNPEWGNLSLAGGLVVNFRARVDSGTQQGAASFRIGDGLQELTVVLDSQYVILKGTGGVAGQVGYSNLNTSDWHEYLLVVSVNGVGQTVASLYLDDNLTTPILSQFTMGSSYDAIQFGDLVGTANGAMDVDFLRWAPISAANPVPEPATALALAGVGMCMINRRDRIGAR